MSFYQAGAENGPAFCQKAGTHRGNAATACRSYTPLDGIVFPDAHPGNPVQALRDLNPAVSMKAGKIVIDPALDPFSEANGFNPKRRLALLRGIPIALLRGPVEGDDRPGLNRVLDRAGSMKKGTYRYGDDDIVVIPGGGNPGAGAGGDGHLAHMDPSIKGFMETARPERLLKNDGSIVTQIVHSVAVAEPEEAKANRGFDTGTKVFTFRSFLSANATRSTNALDGDRRLLPA